MCMCVQQKYYVQKYLNATSGIIWTNVSECQENDFGNAADHVIDISLYRARLTFSVELEENLTRFQA